MSTPACGIGQAVGAVFRHPSISLVSAVVAGSGAAVQGGGRLLPAPGRPAACGGHCEPRIGGADPRRKQRRGCAVRSLPNLITIGAARAGAGHRPLIATERWVTAFVLFIAGRRFGRASTDFWPALRPADGARRLSRPARRQGAAGLDLCRSAVIVVIPRLARDPRRVARHHDRGGGRDLLVARQAGRHSAAARLEAQHGRRRSPSRGSFWRQAFGLGRWVWFDAAHGRGRRLDDRLAWQPIWRSG